MYPSDQIDVECVLNIKALVKYRKGFKDSNYYAALMHCGDIGKYLWPRPRVCVSLWIRTIYLNELSVGTFCACCRPTKTGTDVDPPCSDLITRYR